LYESLSQEEALGQNMWARNRLRLDSS
jgi:hypothetical protein